MEPKTLADRITVRRVELGLTQADLARIAGVSEAAVSQWESGQTKNLKNAHLFVVADFLNVSPRWLATGQGDKQAAASKTAYKTALQRRDAANSEPVRKAWERAAAGFAKSALVMLLAIPPLLPSKAEAAFNISASHFTHWLRLLRRRMVSDDRLSFV